MFNKLKELFTQTEPKDIFYSILGHEDIKELLKSITHSSAPVHINLQGPPDTGKTAIVKCLFAAYPQLTIAIEGTYVTVAGLIQAFVDKPKAKFLIINEIEKSPKDVRAALLEILENGTISKTTKTETFNIHHPIWLIATCNQIKVMEKTQPELLSRMIVKTLHAYTPEQFLKVAKFRVVREGVTAEVAEYIAQVVLERFGTQVRKAVALARLAKTIQDVDRNIELI